MPPLRSALVSTLVVVSLAAPFAHRAAAAADPVGQVTAFTDGITGRTEGAALGPDGNVWFTEPLEDLIGRITPAGAVTEFRGLSAGADPSQIAAGPDGNMWFTERARGAIGRITMDGVVTEFSAGIPAGAELSGITRGDDGAMWFAGVTPAAVGRISMDGRITWRALPDSPQLGAIAQGPSGWLWMTGLNVLALYGLAPDGTSVTIPVDMPPAAARIMPGLALGPDGNMWFTTLIAGSGGGFLNRDTGQVTLVDLAPAPGAWPFTDDVVAGSDGNMWVTGWLNRILRVGTGTNALSITRTGTGSGTVTSSPSRIECGTVCRGFFPPAATVTLTARPADGSRFTGWSGGGCAGTTTCTVSMASDRAVTAAFDVPTSPAAALSAQVMPARTRLRRGQRMRVSLRVRNTGEAPAQDVIACIRVPRPLVITAAARAARTPGRACVRPGDLAGGASVTRSVTVQAIGRPGMRARITATARAASLPATTARAATVTVLGSVQPPVAG